jgi:hypothetical protein
MLDSALIIESVAETIAEANQILFQLLELEPFFYQGDAPVGKQYGFSMPREFDPGAREIRQGYQKYSWQIDVLTEFIIAPDANIQLETAGCLLKVNHAIARINQLIRPLPGAMTGHFRAGKLSATQSQQIRSPHHWQVTIVGAAFVDSYIYRDVNGSFREG